MRQMPVTAQFAAIYPELGATFSQTLIGGLLSPHFVVIHNLIR